MQKREVAMALHRLELLRKIRIRRQMNELHMHPGQPRMMEYIGANPGCTQCRLAQALDITPASAAASLKRMEKAGYVQRTQDEKDPRRNCLHLTPEGRQHMERGRLSMDRLDEEMFDGLSTEEMLTLKNLCDKMFDNLADETTRTLNICRLRKAAESPITIQEET